MHLFDILDSKTTTHKNTFLEASAGTGKTFTIEHLVVRLLLEGDNPFELPQILAVTFTREAAGEMKNRIRERLEILSAEKNRKAEAALAQFDEIQVFTIHSFCHRMLSEFAFETGAPLQLASADKPGHFEEMEQTVKDFIHTADHAFAADVAHLLKRARYDFDRLVGKIVGAMQQECSPKELSLPHFSTVSQDALMNEYLTLAPKYKRLKIETYASQVETLSRFLKERDPTLLWKEKVWFFEKMVDSNLKKGELPPKGPHIFEELRTHLSPYLQKLQDHEEMLKRVALQCRKRWETKAKKQDHYTFDDLIKQMGRALSNPGFLEKVRQKYKAVIIDEFQDTDPLQWTLFETLFLKSHLMYLVGDPKQSIYGFRNADIYTYMRAGEALGNKAYLGTNYRSSPQLIDALNTLFTKNPDWLTLPSLPGALEYHPVKAGRVEAELDEEPIVIFGIRSNPGRERSWPTKKMEEEALFPYVGSEIIRLHEKGVPFSEIALLVKDRFQAQRLQKHLSRWNIPSQVKRTLHLAESRGFVAMELLLKALLHPEKERSTRPALLSPLMQDVSPHPFFRLRELFEEKGFAPLFSHFMTHHFIGFSDESLIQEFTQTATLLMQEPGATIEELLHLMDRLKKTAPDMDERLKISGDEGVDQVPILTTFASKGLEYMVVFAIGMASRHNQEESDDEKIAEKLRQLYVAFTRAREKLYIPYLCDTEGAPPTRGAASPLELFFKDGLEPTLWVKQTPIRPFQPRGEDLPLLEPKKVSLDFGVETLTSFTAMAKGHTHVLLAESFKTQDLGQKSPHTLPLGAHTGTLVHTLFETHFQDRRVPIEQIVMEGLSGTQLEGWEETVAQMIGETLQAPLLPGFCVNDLPEGSFFPEMEFLFPEEGKLIKGFVDLVFQRGDTFYILDWKTNWLGPSDEAYTETTLHQAMEAHDYYLQAKLYSEAVKRYVKRLYISPQFGGAFYVFVRGKKGVHIGTC